MHIDSLSKILLTAFATLGVNLCNLHAQESKDKLVFRIASAEPAPGLVEHHLPGKGGAVFVSETDIIDSQDIERISFFKDRQGARVIGLTFTDVGAKKIEKATSENAPAAKANAPSAKADAAPSEEEILPSTQFKKLAILLNGKLITAPNIVSTVSKEASITGRLSDEELTQIFSAVVLGHNADGT